MLYFTRVWMVLSALLLLRQVVFIFWAGDTPARPMSRKDRERAERWGIQLLVVFCTGALIGLVCSFFRD